MDNPKLTAVPGRFITIEGGDWCGKSTQLQLLIQRLTAAGITTVATFEPGATGLGQQIRQLVMHGEDLSPRTEALLYAADRAHHVDTVIRPALSEGKTVVSDRYWDSSVTYQGAGRDLGLKWIEDLSRWATNNLEPDLTILLDGDPAQLQVSRGSGRMDRIEAAGLGFHNRVRETFLQIASSAPQRIKVIDAQQSISQVAEAIWTEVTKCFGWPNGI